MPELRVPEQINPSARAAARKVPPYYTLTQLLQMKKIRVDIQNRSDLNDRYDDEDANSGGLPGVNHDGEMDNGIENANLSTSRKRQRSAGEDEYSWRRNKILSKLDAAIARHNEHVREYARMAKLPDAEYPPLKYARRGAGSLVEWVKDLADSPQDSRHRSDVGLAAPHRPGSVVPVKFGGLQAFLSSYVHLDDEMTPAAAAERAQKDARTLLRSFETQERKSLNARASEMSFSDLPVSSEVVQEALVQSARMRQFRSYRSVQITSRNKLVEKRFADIKAREEKVRREQEQTRRRNAKAVARIIQAQWELAEKVTLARKKAVEEEIQKEHGLERLNNFVEQSASILSTQRSAALSPPREESVNKPHLVKHELREYQLAGLKWLVNLYNTSANGILADEMGLGKTIQTIALFAYLASERGSWGPHLVVVPTSVLLNWEREFKKWCPALKILTYSGNVFERAEKRKGWSRENVFHVCLTSYQLAQQDQKIFRRRKWVYLVLDEGHYIKNYRGQRWQSLLNINAERRLILTGTPLQNNLTELWSLMYFLMPHGSSGLFPEGFVDRHEFKQWFGESIANVVENDDDSDEYDATIRRLHTILRPFILRRVKAEVEKQLPKKYEHVVVCAMSRRQRYLYDNFLAKMRSKDNVGSNYLSVINIIMQLRKVCNHPDLIAERAVDSPFSPGENVLANFESAICAVQRVLLSDIELCDLTLTVKKKEFPPKTRWIIDIEENFADFSPPSNHIKKVEERPISVISRDPNIDFSSLQRWREEIQQPVIPKVWKDLMVKQLLCQFVVPKAVTPAPHSTYTPSLVSFPDKWLLQHDCGKLQRLFALLLQLQIGSHRALIFTQMTRMLDILEQFLTMHGMRYLRLDGSTSVEQRLILTERFNNDTRHFVFILSTRSGGVGVNLTGADTVIFYDSDWSYQMDKQCQDRCHRIGQTRDVHIYRFVCEHTIEDSILRKSNQKRKLDDVVIQKGQFTMEHFRKSEWRELLGLDQLDTNEVDFNDAIKLVEDDVDVVALDKAEKEIRKEERLQEKDNDLAEDSREIHSVDEYMISFIENEYWIRVV